MAYKIKTCHTFGTLLSVSWHKYHKIVCYNRYRVSLCKSVGAARAFLHQITK